jgi:hypothetical protein
VRKEADVKKKDHFIKNSVHLLKKFTCYRRRNEDLFKVCFNDLSSKNTEFTFFSICTIVDCKLDCVWLRKCYEVWCGGIQL